MGETVADKVKVSLGMPRTSAMAIWTVLQLLDLARSVFGALVKSLIMTNGQLHDLTVVRRCNSRLQGLQLA